MLGGEETDTCGGPPYWIGSPGRMALPPGQRPRPGRLLSPVLEFPARKPGANLDECFPVLFPAFPAFPAAQRAVRLDSGERCTTVVFMTRQRAPGVRGSLD